MLGLLLTGCQTFYSSIVTVTSIYDSAIEELGVLYRQGLISPETDAKIGRVDKQYRLEAATLESMLVAYKNGTTTVEPTAQLQIVKTYVRTMLDILAPYAVKGISTYYVKLDRATQL